MHEPEAQNCWAPEIVWDDAKQHYLIFWSTTILGRFPGTAMSNKRPERMSEIQSSLDHLCDELVQTADDRLEAMEW